MKKVEIKGKLSLNKMTIAKLNDHEVKAVVGGGIMSIGRRCTTMAKCGSTDVTRGKYCNWDNLYE